MATTAAYEALKSAADHLADERERLTGTPCQFDDAGVACTDSASWLVARSCDRRHLSIAPACAEHGRRAERLVKAGHDALCATCRRTAATGFFSDDLVADPVCPSCGASGDEEGPCGSCDTWFTTCYGTNVPAGEHDDDDLGGHGPVSWTQEGTTTTGDLCPRCVHDQ